MSGRHIGERVAVCALLFGGPFTFWYETRVVLPSYMEDGEEAVSNIQFYWAIFLLFQVYTNMFLTFKHGTGFKKKPVNTSHGIRLVGEGTTSWRFCEGCQGYMPPRAHHCPLCDTCVLKRDHHCYFAGTCVGYANHRYYLIMITYLWMAALFYNLLNVGFVVSTLGGISVGNLFFLCMPHVSWLVGYFTGYQAVIAGLSFISFIVLILLTWLIKIQIVQIYNGQTEHEHKKNVTIYNHGLVKNIQEILGEKSIMVFLCPWIFSKLPGDGIEFKTRPKDV